ncbi:MAG: GEGP motif-containing diheme protein [Thermodesulfobacteriota bacterium]
MMKGTRWPTLISFCCCGLLFLMSATAYGAYHHEGEQDAGKFLQAYPTLAGTKLDHCALCHSGGAYTDSKGKQVKLGSCQWCHYSYGYDGAGDIATTINSYGAAYKSAGRNADAVKAIDGADADGDSYSNQTELAAGTFPGDNSDHPGLQTAPYRIYTREQLEGMEQHTQFMLMNTSRSGDSYDQYSGVPMKTLLDDAGITSAATNITVYAPDGWSQYHPLEYESSPEMYHVYGNMPNQDYQYPPATYSYDLQADVKENPTDGWCDYSAPSCAGRANGDSIPVTNGLKAILAILHEGVYLTPGVLTQENKLDGEGPFRVVVPQKSPNPPDQSSKAANQDVIWPYTNGWDHNAGACTRSATIIKISPLPEGTTDINVLESGWNYVDQNKIIVYGAIDSTDSNANGVLDSEEKGSAGADHDSDGVADYADRDTARFRHANGNAHVLLHTSQGYFADVLCMGDDDPGVSQVNKPAASFPYGVFSFRITDLTPGATVTVELEMPSDVAVGSKYYKIDATNGWRQVSFGSNDGDQTITLQLTDGDAATDGDGIANGVIVDPGALAVTSSSGSTELDDDDDICFISTLWF